MSVYCIKLDCPYKACVLHDCHARNDRAARYRDFEGTNEQCLKVQIFFEGKPTVKKKPAEPLVPTEGEEQEALFEWAETMEYMYPELRALYHITNEGKRSKSTGARLKREGLREGVSDICLPVKRGSYGSLYIELKRRKGSRVSDEQRDWIDLMWELGNAAYVCYGWEEARERIEGYLKLEVNINA